MSVRALIVDIIKFIYGHLGHANNTSMLRLLLHGRKRCYI